MSLKSDPTYRSDSRHAEESARPPVDELFDNLHEAVYVTDSDRRILYWNRAAEELTGYAAEDVLGRQCSDDILNHVDQEGNRLCAGSCPLSASIEDGSRREAQVYLTHKRGHRVPITVRVQRRADSRTGEMYGVEYFISNDPRSMLQIRLAEMEELAYGDPLTEVANRRLLTETVGSRLEDLKRYGWPFGVILLDVDHFKTVNDSIGHDAGDEVLKMVARSLDHASRGTDLVGRWGGEEFMVVAPGATGDQLHGLAERLRAMVAASSVRHDGRKVTVTVSTGGTAARPEDTVESVAKRADEALYESKEGGRNRCTTV